MAKWFAKLGLGVMSLGFLALSPMSANADACDPCDPCDPCDSCDFGDFTFGVDFLYWKPCVDDLDYAVVGHGAATPLAGLSHGSYKHHDVCPSWEPGVRVSFSMPDFWCDWALKGSWTYVDVSESSKTVASAPDCLFSTAIHPTVNKTSANATSIRGRYELSYHDFDVLLSYDLCKKGCHTFSPFWGIGFLYAEQDFNVTVRTSETAELSSQERIESKWNDEFFGFGFKFGSNWNYRFSDCMSFYANAWAALLVGEQDGSLKISYNDHSSIDTGSNFREDDCCMIVPGYHIGAGLLYETCACDMDFAFKFGYEFTNWSNISNHRRYSYSTSSSVAKDVAGSSNSVRNLGMHGLVVGLQMGF